jgi:malate dehydrogenase (oxaloacetate-decarboxylating)/malate dehydrogenase (oxaloacetate-decarboxylating)(NADP+)
MALQIATTSGLSPFKRFFGLTFQRFAPSLSSRTNKVGIDVLRDPAINKGTAFTKEERDRFHLRGLLPYKVFTLEEQVSRVQRQFELMPTPLLKYIYLSTEREKNEQVFWRFLYSYPPELTMPVLYTPTVGEACTKWATHRPSYRGIYITPDDKGHIK